jgi:hypothetical protein
LQKKNPWVICVPLSGLLSAVLAGEAKETALNPSPSRWGIGTRMSLRAHRSQKYVSLQMAKYIHLAVMFEKNNKDLPWGSKK